MFNIDVHMVFMFRIRTLSRNINTVFLQYEVTNGINISGHIPILRIRYVPKCKDILDSILMYKRFFYFGSELRPEIQRPFGFNINVHTVIIFRIRVVRYKTRTTIVSRVHAPLFLFFVRQHRLNHCSFEEEKK